MLDKIMENKYAIIGAAIIIFAIAIVLRSGLLQYQGLFEPDGFFYYTVTRQMVVDHVIKGPATSTLSGFPIHNNVGESPELFSIVVISYDIVSFAGVSLLSVMRWLPIIFALLEIVSMYFIARQLSNSKAFGLLAMALLAVNSGNIARTAGTVFRGDSFVSLFLMVSIVLMLMAYNSQSRKRMLIFSVLASFVLSCSIIVWNGAPFANAVYLFAIILVLIYSFLRSDERLSEISVYLSLGLILSYLFEIGFAFGGFARLTLYQGKYLPLLLSDSVAIFSRQNPSLFIPYVITVIAAVLSYYLVKNRSKLKIFDRFNEKVGLLVFLVLIVAIVFALLYTRIVGLISAVGTGSAVQIAQTTQELQGISYSFLTSSFGLQLFLAPLGIILFIFLENNKDSIKWGKFNLSLGVAFLVAIAYFTVTGYLQSTAIRYNALLSIPVSLFAAYAIYIIGKRLYNKELRGRLAYISAAIILIAVALFVLYTHSVFGSGFKVVTASYALLVAILAGVTVYALYSLIKKPMLLKYACMGIIVAILIYAFYNTYLESFTAVQADGINPQFLQAMSWMKNNTASNATVLALWPDGSVVEGWANRTSYMDSVGGENGTRIFQFTQYLFNNTVDYQYLYSIGRPEYLVARNFWYEELGGIAQEGNISNSTSYGYVILNSLNSTSNGTAQFFSFSSDQYPYYKSELVIVPVDNGTTTLDYAYFGLQNNSRLELIRNILFVNSTNNQYSMVNSAGSTLNNSANYTLMLLYDGRIVNGAFILGPKLLNSNLFKFTFLCNYQGCPYNSTNVNMSVVYSNSDTRILKITYPK